MSTISVTLYRVLLTPIPLPPPPPSRCVLQQYWGNYKDGKYVRAKTCAWLRFTCTLRLLDTIGSVASINAYEFQAPHSRPKLPPEVGRCSSRLVFFAQKVMELLLWYLLDRAAAFELSKLLYISSIQPSRCIFKCEQIVVIDGEMPNFQELGWTNGNMHTHRDQ